MKQPAVFLDRDGVLNQALIRDGKPFPPVSLADVEILPKMITALQRLANHGFVLIGITNQPDVARAAQTREVVESINQLIQSRMPVQELFVCYHDDFDECDCRKPKPGLIIQAAQKYDLDLSLSWMVGDRWKDIAAGQAAGTKTIFIDYHYNEVYVGQLADFSVEAPACIAEIILEGSN